MARPTGLVVGGAKPGIGQAVTRRLLSSGTAVTATFEPDELGSTADFLRGTPDVQWLELDTRAGEPCLDLLDRLADVHCVVDAEFFFYLESSTDFDLARWRRSLLVNLTLPKAIGHRAINSWPSCRSVVFITSSEARTGSVGAHAYTATKAAVHNLTMSLANTAGDSCRFNSLAAGWVGGVMDTDEALDRSRQLTPLGRLGGADEIASAAVWLSSEEASFVNGATLRVDGGYAGADAVARFEYEREFGS